METLFWACLAGGLLYAFITVIFGDWLSVALDGALDFLSVDGHPWLQSTSIVSGITVFGGAGLLLEKYSSLGAFTVVALAVLIAIAAAVLLFFLYVRPMQNSENSVGYSIAELAGQMGEVLVAIPAKGYGEVMVKVGAGNTNQIAASFEGAAIPSGARVVVVEVKDGTLLVSEIHLG
ncbi:NfeD family protein [Paenibacillus sp. GCM10023252]|uniref:NfeD family protein n=1 Tax=Paenibacillus sp. GCM10023252 TaxID=3252649 RepID=UPI0036243C5C